MKIKEGSLGMKEKIDPELLAILSTSEWNAIDYANLIVDNPAQIRKEEKDLSLKEIPLIAPTQLEVNDIWIPSSDKLRNIRLRTYRPKEKADLPVLLYFHGGAFIFGTPEQYDFIFFRLALDVGMLIVSVDYRLAPENPFPAGMDDGYDTLLWLSEKADQIGGNCGNILIGGSSAGATIASSITHMARDRKEVDIKHQYLLYPPTCHRLRTLSMHELANAPMQTRQSAAWMWKHYLQDKIDSPPRYAVPMWENNFENLPKATIIVCELDPLKDEGKKYAQKLKQANVSVNLLEIPGAVHAFDFFPCSLSDSFYEKQIELFKHIVHQ
ncbi:alpha/beta hydrolase [Sphingobacterium sp. LRF_L2]|uniref:alpha/beta hydrolase n=1 Tax=Sphingobacterium sp. LRF_L2 TaxID=3369421 RepID=UPI003F6136BC